MASLGYSGAQWKLIHEKNLKMKILCQTHPFHMLSFVVKIKGKM
jgi:hypothetical protein